ncbi:MAG: RNA recognition motif domain-containing protein [Planctomycetota bacterium]
MGNKLYVGNLAYEVDRDQLEAAFAPHGTITDCTVIIDRDSGRSKGFGFVELSTDEEAQRALEAMDGVELEGRALRVSEARPREPRRY